VKFSVRQIFASAGGAVLAAVIASFFGVKGTIVGVAIGSSAATFGTALLAQSIERGQAAVKQVVVRAPEQVSLLRRMGGTRATGADGTSTAEESALTEETASAGSQADETAPMETASTAETTARDVAAIDATAPIDAAALMETASAADASAADAAPIDATAVHPMTFHPTAEMAVVGDATTAELPVTRPVISRHNIPWRAIAGTAAVVFLIALVTITVIELIAGQPLADLVGGHTKTHNPTLFQPNNPTVVPPATTSTTTSTTSTTSTTTSTTSTTTTTTVPGETTTTSSGATTTTLPGETTTTSSGTTTTTGPGTTTTTAPG
jgi:hypothetical protein